MIFQVFFHKSEVSYLEQKLSGNIICSEPYLGNPDFIVVSLQINQSQDIQRLFNAGVMHGIDQMYLSSQNKLQ